jgi:hypothetical protein
MISEKMRMQRVKIVEKTPTIASPYTSYTNDPTIDAPTVFAMVFRHRIAEIGLSEFCLSLFSLAAPLTPCSSSPVMYDKGVERRVASRVEHNADSKIEISIMKYMSCSSIELSL